MEFDFTHASLTALCPSRFTVVSTFSGCGGSSLGYVWVGGKVLAAIEWDAHAVETYQWNFPETLMLHTDIAKVSVEDILGVTGLQVGELDILDGSPPCQGVSMIGKRQIDDPRNSLFKEYVRLLRGLQPKVFIMENVGGMLKGYMKHVFARIMRELKASGYRVKCQLMNTAYYGVPQSRERVIFMGVRNDLGIEPSYPKPQARQTPFVPFKDSGDARIFAPEKWRQTKEHKVKQQAKGNTFGYHFHVAGTPMRTVAKEALSGNCNLIRYGETARQMSTAELRYVGSYPEVFAFPGSYEQMFQRIGNSVPPLFMKCIAEHVYEHILSENQETSNDEKEKAIRR